MAERYENTFVREVKEKNITKPEDILNWYRNLYHTEDNHTEHGIVAYAINDFFDDVVPKSEVENIFFEFARKLNQMLPFKASSLINGEPLGNSFDLGKERTIYEILNFLKELEKKYMEVE